MAFKPLVRRLGTGCVPFALVLLLPAAGFGDTGCPTGCQRWHCPAPYVHCQERPPRICIKKACPRPVCLPCQAPNWGYYQPCWRPWPWPADLSHCPYPTPAALVDPGCPCTIPTGSFGAPGALTPGMGTPPPLPLPPEPAERSCPGL